MKIILQFGKSFYAYARTLMCMETKTLANFFGIITREQGEAILKDFEKRRELNIQHQAIFESSREKIASSKYLESQTDDES